MEVLKWIDIVYAIGCVVFFAFFASVAGRMIFVARFAELSLIPNRTLRVLWEGLRVSEISHQLPPLERDYQPGAGDVPATEEVQLTPDGKLEEEQHYFDGDPRRSVQVLSAIDGVVSKVLFDRKVFARNGDELGPQLADLSDGPFAGFRYVGNLNNDWFLVAGHPAGKTYGDAALWQVSHEDYSAILLQENVYYTFHRPPKIFTPEGFPGVLLAVYVDDVSYGFGGNCSEPRYSILRVYTENFPAGIDLVQFSLKAGVIVAVEWRDGELLVTANPSRPTGNEGKRPPRIWSVALPDHLVSVEKANRTVDQTATVL